MRKRPRISKPLRDQIEQGIARGEPPFAIADALDVPVSDVQRVRAAMDHAADYVDEPVDEPVDDTPMPLDIPCDEPPQPPASTVPNAPILDLSVSCGHAGLLAAARDEMARVYGTLCPEHHNRRTA